MVLNLNFADKVFTIIAPDGGTLAGSFDVTGMHNRYRRLDRQTLTSTEKLPVSVQSVPANELLGRPREGVGNLVEPLKYTEMFEGKSPFSSHLLE